VSKPKKFAHSAAGSAAPSAPIERSHQPALADANGRYAEYLRVLEQVPVLVDVVSEPPHVVIRDFRLGQRPNVRKGAREDAYAVREQQANEVEQAYCEYVDQTGRAIDDVPTLAALAPKKKARRPKNSKRSKRRKG
jgi:N-acyl-D-aspartate/D-glutamate deacylase